MSIFIEWDEQQREFVDWRVVSGLGTVPTFKTITVTKSVRYSSEDTPELRQRALQWIETDRPNGRIVIK